MKCTCSRCPKRARAVGEATGEAPGKAADEAARQTKARVLSVCRTWPRGVEPPPGGSGGLADSRAFRQAPKKWVPHNKQASRMEDPPPPPEPTAPRWRRKPPGFKLQCDRCDYATPWRSNLAAHARTHSGAKPFACAHAGCGRSFAQKVGLSRHTRTHTQERPFECPHPGCEATFAHASTLKEHLQRHGQERPWFCERPGCGARFKCRSDLAKHVRVHGGERPFECDVVSCGASFARKASLADHKRRVHADQVGALPTAVG